MGKSTFVRHAFDLSSSPAAPFTFRKMSIDGSVYIVRLVELTYDDLDTDSDSRISWPEVLNGVPVPAIDGALTLYDVMNKESLAQVPQTLGKPPFGIVRYSVLRTSLAHAEMAGREFNAHGLGRRSNC